MRLPAWYEHRRAFVASLVPVAEAFAKLKPRTDSFDTSNRLLPATAYDASIDFALFSHHQIIEFVILYPAISRFTPITYNPEKKDSSWYLLKRDTK